MTEIKLLHENYKTGVWKLPTLATPGSAAMDLRAAIDEMIVIPPFKTEMIPSGLSVYYDNSKYALLLMPKSGTGCKRGITLGNTIGLIDSDYQGELKFCIYNRSDTSIEISPGEEICQMMLVAIETMTFTIVEEFSTSTSRGENGFGSNIRVQENHSASE